MRYTPEQLRRIIFFMKFRVLSDLHIDINEGAVPSFDDDVFTVVCGDTSGDPAESINWIQKNVHRGVGVSGNHLPYNNRGLEIQALRDELAEAFPKDGPFTYLDAECGTVSKVVDGVMFVSSSLCVSNFTYWSNLSTTFMVCILLSVVSFPAKLVLFCQKSNN